ncbi:hypothetical protein [Macellibacteroides fermentans]|nr:hypothetical protein [Parabacteroides chartae]
MKGIICLSGERFPVQSRAKVSCERISRQVSQWLNQNLGEGS